MSPAGGSNALSAGCTAAHYPKARKAGYEESWAIPLLSLQWLMKYAVHLGGKSALDMAGYAHYLKLGGRSRVHFYGEVPSWLKRLPIADRDRRAPAFALRRRPPRYRRCQS